MRREKREREERPGRRVGFKTILHFIEIVVIAAAVVFVANRFAPKNETQITSSFISDKLEMVSELTTAKLTYNGLVYYSDGSIPLLTQKSFTMTYRAEVRAGVDLSQTDIKITDKEVQLILPAVQILDTVVDSDSIQFYDEKAALLNWGKKTDVLDGMTAAQKDVEEKADFDSLKAEAKTQTRQLLTGLFAGAIGERELVVKFAE